MSRRHGGWTLAVSYLVRYAPVLSTARAPPPSGRNRHAALDHPPRRPADDAGDHPEALRLGRDLAPRPDRATDHGRRRGPDPHPRGRTRPRHLAPDDRQALRDAPGLRPARTEEEPGARA